MPGTSDGGKQAAETNRMLYGADFYQRIGAMGGVWMNPKKGFGSNKKLASIAGKKGGRVTGDKYKTRIRSKDAIHAN